MSTTTFLAKRYILQVTDFYSEGIGTTGNTYQYNLCNAFSGTTQAPAGSYYLYNGNIIYFTATTYNYPQINLPQLANLTIPDYENRAFYFLDYVNINTMNRRNELLNQGTYFVTISGGTKISNPYFFNRIEKQKLTYLFNRSENAPKTYVFNRGEL
jgi:hypothetical protein